MGTTFKAGDIVVCIDNHGADYTLKKGEVYIIKRVTNDFVIVEIDKKDYRFWSSRFDPVTPIEYAPDHPHPLKPLTGHDVFKASELTSYAKGVQDTLKDRIGDAKARKAIPLFSGCINYFPDALLAVAELSRIGNDQHNPGQPLHWDRSKSSDELDALARHLVDAGTIDTDNVRHSTKVAWRALANLQKEIEKDRNR